MPARPRILWLHTQPEHYFNCMMDDLARQGSCDYIAAFSGKGTGWYTETPLPKLARTVFLQPRGASSAPMKGPTRHADWRKDLYPLDFDAAIVAGYGLPTHREVIHDCHRRGIPVAMFSDSNLRSQRGRSVKARLQRFAKRRFLAGLIRDTDLMLTANRLGVAYWRYFGTPAAKIVVCPYYADYARVAAAAQTARAAVLEQHRLPPDARYLYTAARLVPAKGLDLMIAAFRRAGLADRGFHYVIAGVGALESSLKAQAGPLLGKCIHFVGFQQPTDNLALTAHADLFVLPSTYEPHGIVVQESLAAGTPVLASDVCGAAYDLVNPGISGEFFTSGDVASLAEKLELLLGNPARLDAMRKTARQEFDRWFSEYSPMVVVEAAVKRLLAPHSNTPPTMSTRE